MTESAQSAKRIIVTGGNSGLGFHTAERLASAGHELVLAVRNTDRGWSARQRILARHPEAEVSVVELDLASLASVREFASHVAETFGGWDVLINNAGVTLTVNRQFTKDRFELQFGTNHLGHFALTGLLLPMMTDDARVVTLYSAAYRWGRIRFHDLRWDNGYTPMRAYSMSKLANLLFARELHRKSEREQLPLRSIAVNPGWALAANPDARALRRLRETMAGDVGEAAAIVAWAANDDSVPAGALVGPSGLLRIKGEPSLLPEPRIRDEEAIARRLWLYSSQLTRVSW